MSGWDEYDKMSQHQVLGRIAEAMSRSEDVGGALRSIASAMTGIADAIENVAEQLELGRDRARL